MTLVVVALMIGAGCDRRDVAPTAPLGAAESTPAGSCFRADATGSLTKHVATFTAPDEGLDLISLSLLHGDGLAVIDSVVLPFAGNPDTTGTFLRYPPGTTVIADSLMTWPDRQALAGAHVDAGDGQQALLVGLRIDADRGQGTVAGFRLEYVDSAGAEHTRDYPGRIRIKRKDPCTLTDFAD